MAGCLNLNLSSKSKYTMSKQTEIIKLASDELPTLSALVKLNSMPGVDAHTIALQELEYLKQQAVSKPVIFECLPETVIAGVKYVIKNNLSFDPNAGLVYIKSRNLQVNTAWVKALEVQPSADGLISIARQCGRVLDVDRPEVKKDVSGKVISVIAKFLIPSFDGNGKPITRWTEREFDESDFYRWQRASHNENARTWKADSGKAKPDAETLNYANPNYTNWKGGIDPEFARAKAIRHGLKKLGTNQNETRATRIVTSVEKKHVVETQADEAAMNDEGNGDYIPHEDIPATKVHVTTHEEMEIPTL